MLAVSGVRVHLVLASSLVRLASIENAKTTPMPEVVFPGYFSSFSAI
jgi:hypothetical protein